MDWPTLLTSFSSAVIVASLGPSLGPRLQHYFWKKQKRGEQRLAVAERFGAMNANFWLVINVVPPTDDHARRAADETKFLEQDALLTTVMVLFERRDTRDSASRLRECLNSRPQLPHEHQQYEEYIKTLYALRVDLSTRLFAEALEISTERLIKRNAAPSSRG